jgi:ABC-type antimicrobial peptide transport system permease subunit
MLVLSEGILVSIISGGLGILLALLLSRAFNLKMPIQKALWILPMSVLLCLLGYLLPAFQATRVSPSRMIVRGEATGHKRKRFRALSTTSYALSQMFVKRTRTGLAILTTIIATTLNTLFIGLILYTRGYLIGTLLGEQILMHIGGYHLIFAIVSFLIAGLSISDLLLMSLSERKREIGVLKAVGWRSADVLRLFLKEGVILGFIGGLGGVILGSVVLFSSINYRIIQLPLIVIISLIFPVLIALVSSLFPARMATRVPPAETVRYE